MKRETREQAIARAERAERGEFLARLALILQARGNADVMRKFHTKEDGWFSFALFGARRADGGVLVVTNRQPGQPPYVSVYALENYRREISERAYAGIEWAIKARDALDEISRAQTALVVGPERAHCPLCEARPLDLQVHLDTAHEFEMEARRKNAADPVVAEIEKGAV